MLAAKWVGCMENGQQTTLDERFVRNTFGNAFADELMRSKRGFVDVPVGDNKVFSNYTTIQDCRRILDQL